MTLFHQACIQIYVDTYLKLKLERCIKQRNAISAKSTAYNQLLQTLNIFKNQREKHHNVAENANHAPIQESGKKQIAATNDESLKTSNLSSSTNVSLENSTLSKSSNEASPGKTCTYEPLEAFMDIGLHHYVKVVVPETEKVPVTIDIGANTKVECYTIDEAIALAQSIANDLDEKFKLIQQEAVQIRDSIKACLNDYRALGVA